MSNPEAQKMPHLPTIENFQEITSMEEVEKVKPYMGQIHAECDCPTPDKCVEKCLAENKPQTTEFNRAIDNTRYQFGKPGIAAIRMLLDNLPSDATINWGEGHWVPCAVVAEQLRQELQHD